MENVYTPLLTKRRILLLSLEILLFAYIAPESLYRGYVRAGANIFVLVSVFLIVLALVLYRIRSGTWKKEHIGIGTKVTRMDVVRYGALAVLGCMVLISYDYLHPMTTRVTAERIVEHSVIGSAMQVFLFQGYLMKMGQELTLPAPVNCGVNIILFTNMHKFYSHGADFMILIFLAGCVFTWAYYKCPNLWMACGIHIVLNATGVFTGLLH